MMCSSPPFVQSYTPTRRSARSFGVAAQYFKEIKAFLQSPCLLFRARANAPIPLCGSFPLRRVHTTACFHRQIPTRLCQCPSALAFAPVRHTTGLLPFLRRRLLYLLGLFHPRNVLRVFLSSEVDPHFEPDTSRFAMSFFPFTFWPHPPLCPSPLAQRCLKRNLPTCKSGSIAAHSHRTKS